MVGDVSNNGKIKKGKNGSKKFSFFENVQNYFTEYSENTGLHGFRYIGEQNRTIIEKVWWLISLSIALYFCIALIIRTYQKWESSPVIVSFATKETPIWQIPFPSVTICPETKSVPKVFNYTDHLYKKYDSEDLSEEEELKLSYISFLCNYEPNMSFNLDNYVIPDDLFTFFEKVAPKFFDNISECFFMGKAQNCSDIFTAIITDEGLCYSFNLLDREDILRDNVEHHKNFHSLQKKGDWSLEHGYKNKSKKNTYPRRALHAGALFDFELKLRTHDEDLDFICGSSIQGYKIQIHHPAMLPRVKQQHFRIPLDQALIAAMMPSIMTTSEAIKAYTPERRQCFLPSERYLKYFKIYTQQNCQIECNTNYTLRMCGCVDFYMPRENKTKICGAPLKTCMMKAEDDLLSEGIDASIMKSRGLKPQNVGAHKIINECDCMPECTAMTYIIENTQSEWDWVRRYQYDRNAIKYNKTTTHMSYLQIFFKGNQFITSERNELYGPTDFLANFGGLLGLFTGFSMLSSIEVLYYLTLRLICNIKLFGRRNWSGKN